MTSSIFESLPSQAAWDDVVFAPVLLAGAIAYLTNGRFWNKPDPFHYKLFERPQDQISKTATQARTRNIAERLSEVERDVVIFWGSQSGTAEGYAHRLAKDLAQRFQLHSLVADLSDYDADTIADIPTSKFALFLVSTYGEGDPSDNAVEFMGWLGSRPAASLASLRYAAIGFGNSNYKYFNKVVDDLQVALDGLGASLAFAVTKADEGLRSTEEDYMEWKEKLYTFVTAELGYREQQAKYEPAISVAEDSSLPDSGLQTGKPISSRVYKAGLVSDVAWFPVTEHRELVADRTRGGSCVHLDVDLTAHPSIKYKSGDHIAVWPSNPSEEVTALLEVLGLSAKANQRIQIQPLDAENDLKLPTTTTILALFTHYLEICAPVPRETVLNLASFATSALVRDEFASIASSRESYAHFLSRTQLTFTRLLAYTQRIDPNCSWATLPLPFVIESIPAMTPRLYSISSSSLTTPRKVSITCSVKPTPLPAEPTITIPGLASTYLHQTLATSRVHAQIRRSTFKLPASPRTPLILVAAGTGIAPMRAFLLDRARLAHIGQQVGKTLLFFGCRSSAVDFLYGDELTRLAREALHGSLEIVTAFSREDGVPKRYVQDAVGERLDEVAELLVEGEASYYVCGATKMAKGVEKAIGMGIMKRTGWDETQLGVWRAGKKKDQEVE